MNDGGGTDNYGDDASSGTFTITVNPVNDFPSFTIGADQTLLEDDGNTSISIPGGEHLISNWATDINLGPDNEVTDFGQNATFTLTTTNDGLFLFYQSSHLPEIYLTLQRSTNMVVQLLPSFYQIMVVWNLEVWTPLNP